jgi:DNA-binding response OmpR family regulator
LQNKGNTTKWHRYRILLVDDDPDITFSFKIGLEDNGFVVDAYNDPLLALSSYKVGLYDMAILDIKMPKMNGFELSGQIRKLDDGIKISFMSAFDIHKDSLKAAVPTQYEENLLILRKPLSMNDFVSRIRENLG